MTGEELVDVLDTMNPIGQYEEGVRLCWTADISDEQIVKHLNYWKYYRDYALEELPDNYFDDELFEI